MKGKGKLSDRGGSHRRHHRHGENVQLRRPLCEIAFHHVGSIKARRCVGHRSFSRYLTRGFWFENWNWHPTSASPGMELSEQKSKPRHIWITLKITNRESQLCLVCVHTLLMNKYHAWIEYNHTELISRSPIVWSFNSVGEQMLSSIDFAIRIWNLRVESNF